jgi:hypothetical protein
VKFRPVGRRSSPGKDWGRAYGLLGVDLGCWLVVKGRLVGAPPVGRLDLATASPRPEQKGGGAARLQWSRKARVRGSGDCGIDRGQGLAAAGASADGELGRTVRGGVRHGQGPGSLLRRPAHPLGTGGWAEDVPGDVRAPDNGNRLLVHGGLYGGSGLPAFPAFEASGGT